MAKLNLTPQQSAAVENRGGSLLVSAAAGSGKTKVLVERLFCYITAEHCHVDDFLIITYTRRRLRSCGAKYQRSFPAAWRKRRGTGTFAVSYCGCIRRISKRWTPFVRRCCGKIHICWHRTEKSIR